LYLVEQSRYCDLLRQLETQFQPGRKMRDLIGPGSTWSASPAR
jgi:hypothetical protein